MTTRNKPVETESAPQFERPSWHEYFMEITELVAKRSTCRRRAVGAIIVKDKRVLSTGYNGAPAGVRHCIDIGCLREELGVASGERHELCRGIHAEQNAIIQAALHGVRIADSTIFCTNQPCVICAKMIINAGIRAIYYKEGYADPMSKQLLEEAAVDLVKLG
jgi:dCMP deaminase